MLSAVRLLSQPLLVQGGAACADRTLGLLSVCLFAFSATCSSRACMPPSRQ